MSTLAVKQAELKSEQDKVEALETDLAETKDKKDTLERDVDDCKRRLIRA